MAKETNEELNLTPFIGLFAMLVVLLLVTAVWNRIEVLSTNSANSTASSNPNPEPEDPNKPKIDLNLTILEDKVQVTVNQKANFIPIVDGNLDLEALKSFMEAIKLQNPEKKDLILYTDNRTPYRHLIQVFDLLIGVGFPDVGVSTQ